MLFQEPETIKRHLGFEYSLCLWMSTFLNSITMDYGQSTALTFQTIFFFELEAEDKPYISEKA